MEIAAMAIVIFFSLNWILLVMSHGNFSGEAREGEMNPSDNEK